MAKSDTPFWPTFTPDQWAVRAVFAVVAFSLLFGGAPRWMPAATMIAFLAVKGPVSRTIDQMIGRRK